jgi:AcrR family transcriptional regulator
VTPRTATLLARALDPEVETPADAISSRVLDAALALAAASGLRHLTMDDVATRARVGRMTVYRRFGSREQLIDALVVREARDVLAQLVDVLDPRLSIEDRIAEGFLAALRVAREHPLAGRLMRVEPEQLLAELTARDSTVLHMCRAFLVAQIREGQDEGELRALDPEPAAELLVRIGFSFVLMPNSVIDLEDDEAVRELARTLIAPIVVSPPQVSSATRTSREQET